MSNANVVKKRKKMYKKEKHTQKRIMQLKFTITKKMK